MTATAINILFLVTGATALASLAHSLWLWFNIKL